MKISPIPGIGTQRALCMTSIRVAAGLKTMAAQRGAWQRNKIGVPVDQCGKRADFLIDDAPTCRAHAGAAALAHMIEAQRPRTDEEEIARPRCGCPADVVRRVIIDHGTCAMAGCPYGGDV